MDDLEGPSDQLCSELEDSMSNLADSLTHSSSGPLSLACASPTSLADTIYSSSVVSMPPFSPNTIASRLPKRCGLVDDPATSNFSPASIVTFTETTVCDWICEKGSYMCNYKYLEIPF